MYERYGASVTDLGAIALIATGQLWIDVGFTHTLRKVRHQPGRQQPLALGWARGAGRRVPKGVQWVQTTVGDVVNLRSNPLEPGWASGVRGRFTDGATWFRTDGRHNGVRFGGYPRRFAMEGWARAHSEALRLTRSTKGGVA